AGAIGQPAGRRNERRWAERHSRAPRHARARARGHQERQDRSGGRRDRRRRHRHGLLRLEGRHRHLVAKACERPRWLHGRRARADQLRREPDDRRRPDLQVAAAAGSCMLVVATDAPLDARDLRRLAARAVFGLGRTGSSYSNGSGDFAIAFSTSPEMRSRFNETAARARVVLPTDATSPLFEAALEATEEAVYNSLFQATTVRSAIGTAEAIPVERVRELLGKR